MPTRSPTLAGQMPHGWNWPVPVGCLAAFSYPARTVQQYSPYGILCVPTNRPAFGPRNSNRRSTFALWTPGAVAELRIMPQEKTRPTVLCPACKTRMSTKQIVTGSFDHTDEFVYHCPMCDTETRQHLRRHQLSPPQAPKTPYWQWRSFKHAAG
jgi:hypothetical protein